MILEEAYIFLKQMDFLTFVKMYWYLIVFDFSRYTLAFLPVVINACYGRIEPKKKKLDIKEHFGQVNVLLAGFNEGASLKASILSLKEQTIKGLKIIVVDDGSTDNMSDVAKKLKREGLIDTFLSTGIRGGKASALNLGLRHCDRDFVLCIDIDTSLDRDAIENMLTHMEDVDVGAVSGDLSVRNKYASLATHFQAIEYLTHLSMGRRFTSLMGILGIVSGAFGLYRREAILPVGGWEVGPGEDSDITNKLRRTKWKIRFAHEALALTDVPVSFAAYIRQRTRWSRSCIRKLRKHKVSFNPFDPLFSLSNLLSLINILYYQVAAACMFYVYLIWIFWHYSEFSILVLTSVALIYLSETLLNFIIVALLYPEREPLRLGLYLIGQSLFQSYIMRAVRFYSYADEFLFRNSYNDSFYPSKVRSQVEKL